MQIGFNLPISGPISAPKSSPGSPAKARRGAPSRWCDWPAGCVPHLLAMARLQLVTAVLAGFGRTISEVGAILIVGGNIAGYTRRMTTAIVVETGEAIRRSASP